MPAATAATTAAAATTPGAVVSSTNRRDARGEVLRLMAKEGAWLLASVAAFQVVINLFNSFNSPSQASGYVFVTTAAAQLCSWLGTTMYFRVSGTHQQPVTPQQWRLLVTSTVSLSLLLVVIQSRGYLLAGDSVEIMLALAPAIVMVISSKFFGKTWSTIKKLAVAPIAVGTALASFYFQGATVMGTTLSVLHGVSAATILVIYGELLTGDAGMSPVQLMSKTAPLSLGQAAFLAFAFGEVTRAIDNSAFFRAIMYAAAVRGSVSVGVQLCRLQAIKVTSSLTMSIAFAVHHVIIAGLDRGRYGLHVRVNFLGFIVLACLRYAVLSFIERSRSLSQAPDDPGPPREQPGRTIEEGAAEEEEDEGDVMLRPLLRAEAQSAASQQDRTAAA